MLLNQVFVGSCDGHFTIMIDSRGFHKMNRVYPLNVHMTREAFEFVCGSLGDTYKCSSGEIDSNAVIREITSDLECALQFYNIRHNWATRRELFQFHRIHQ